MNELQRTFYGYIYLITKGTGNRCYKYCVKIHISVTHALLMTTDSTQVNMSFMLHILIVYLLS